MRCWWALAVVLAGCSAPAVPAAQRLVPVAAATSSAPPSTAAHVAPRMLLTPAQAIEESDKTFKSAGVESPWDVPTQAEKLTAAGMDEQRTLLLAESLAGACLAHDDPCEGFRVDDSSESRAYQVMQLLVTRLSSVGTQEAIPLLARLDARRVYQADDAIERILEARALRATGPCAPPTDAQVARQRADVSDFAVLDHDGKRWTARAPTSQELDDLAYFLAAVADAGAPVGTTLETGPGPLGAKAPADPYRKQWREAARSAWLRGDPAAHADAARAWLASLGYPGPLRAEQDGEMSWGGAEHSYVMRELARSAEILGQLDDAAALYRRANPGGGACGTSVPYRRVEQTRGLIRATEQTAGCGPIVAERLHAYVNARSSFYGPERLARSGFDLARAYRGASLTWGRHIDRTELGVALSCAPGNLGALAMARLQQRGPESWESRVRAWEGFADADGKTALPMMVRRSKIGPVKERKRAIGILQSMVFDSGRDPCHPEQDDLFLSFGSTGPDVRKVRSLNAACATRLTAAERAALVKELAPMLRDKDPDFRVQVAEALGWIGSRAASAYLRPLLADPYHPEGAKLCTISVDQPEVCRDNWPVREAARKALERITTLSSRKTR